MSKCPEFEILSAYFDGEIGSPWDKSIEAHCASCKECCEKVASLSRLREGILAISEPDIADSAARVKVILAKSIDTRTENHAPFWKQSIRIPVPVFAMSVLLVVAFGVVFALRGPSALQNTTFAQNSKEGTGTEVRISPTSENDVEALLKSLDAMGSPQDVVIKLPEGSRFDKVGEPTLIHSVDFKGNSK
jgi:anti-sigma factor RsiW